MEKKEKVLSIGVTDELMAFVNNWMEKQEKKEEEKEGKENGEDKQMGKECRMRVCEIVKSELEKIDGELNKNKKLTDDEWDVLVKKVDKLSEIVRWY